MSYNGYFKRSHYSKRGIAKISKEALNRQHIYRMLSSKGNPSVDNIGSLLNALGLQLKIAACAF
ncbi:DNA-binding protein [Rickettsia sp. 2024-CO-Wats]|uniref:helix-turn-helix domain-containing transcriptional regulator n=1 Tax=unclassified Rickettsia TaxID=114295 RepID=UPI00370D26C0